MIGKIICSGNNPSLFIKIKVTRTVRIILNIIEAINILENK
jgi:hypothetical protein